MKLHLYHAYRIDGMTKTMWQVPHPRWGMPKSIVGVFVGQVEGSRVWYCFEIRVRGKEQGMIFIPDEDLVQLKLKDLGTFLDKGEADESNNPGRP